MSNRKSLFEMYKQYMSKESPHPESLRGNTLQFFETKPTDEQLTLVDNMLIRCDNSEVIVAFACLFLGGIFGFAVGYSYAIFEWIATLI